MFAGFSGEEDGFSELHVFELAAGGAAHLVRPSVVLGPLDVSPVAREAAICLGFAGLWTAVIAVAIAARRRGGGRVEDWGLNVLPGVRS